MLIWNEQCKLEDQRNLNKKTKLSLKLFVDNNDFIRTKERFAKSTLLFQEQYPITLRLSTESDLKCLIILDARSKEINNGIESTMVRIRHNVIYRFCQGKRCVKNVKFNIPICRKFQKAFEAIFNGFACAVLKPLKAHTCMNKY